LYDAFVLTTRHRKFLYGVEVKCKTFTVCFRIFAATIVVSVVACLARVGRGCEHHDIKVKYLDYWFGGKEETEGTPALL
jgi:hypothetical protein